MIQFFYKTLVYFSKITYSEKYIEQPNSFFSFFSFCVLYLVSSDLIWVRWEWFVLRTSTVKSLYHGRQSLYTYGVTYGEIVLRTPCETWASISLMCCFCLLFLCLLQIWTRLFLSNTNNNLKTNSSSSVFTSKRFKFFYKPSGSVSDLLCNRFGT